MKTILGAVMSALVLLGALSQATPVGAQATRTWVSGVGDDANPCSRTAPCKTFAGAISKTAAGGIINVTDPGGFGAVTITKSITIDGDGTHAGILASGTSGVIVNGAGVVVTLRNLSIEGGSPTAPGLMGINFIQGAALHVEHVRIFSFTGGTAEGLHFAPSGNAELFVSDSEIVENGGGVHLVPSGGLTKASFDRVHFDNNNTFGLKVDDNATADVMNSQAAGNGGSGVIAISDGSPGPAASKVSVDSCAIFNNGSFGVVTSSALSTGWISNNLITGNGTGVAVGSGVMNSFGNNMILGNTTNVSGTMTPANPS